MTAAYVTLINGEIVTSDAEAWRHETLARHVSELPTLPERRQWLTDFEKRHGPGSAKSIKDTMAALWKKDKA